MALNEEKQNILQKNSNGSPVVDKCEVIKESSLQEDDLLHRMSFENLQERLNTDFQDLGERLNDLKYNLVAQIELAKSGNALARDFINSDKYCDRGKPSKNGDLPDKQFLQRNSLLTDLFEIKHIRTIYNIFIVILIILFINTAIHDIMETGITHLGVKTVMTGFGKMPIVIHTWIGMTLSTFCLYSAFAFWACKRPEFQPKSFSLKIWDYAALITLLLYQSAFIIFPAKAVIQEDLPPASSLIVLMEQVRMLMKTHAFVRSNTPRVLAYKPHTENPEPSYPGFSKFLYFMFAPTLVYRDSYPRTKEIRWGVVVWNYAEVVLVIFYVAFIFERFLVPLFRQSGVDPLDPRTLILSMFGTMMPGILVFLCGFYCLLHSWMNGSAELLRFADRMFYKDWWNSTSYGSYYRTWNVVVHDWLYAYIYKDMYEIITRKNKFLSTLTVFLVSAGFHEYILAFAFRFFYPVMLVMFGGFGMMFVFITRKNTKSNGNIFLWLTLCSGSGIMLSLYSMEFYARINCAPYDDKILDLFLPRSWFCRKLIPAV
ncbi:sterol O-acyltransferase 1 [Belonocnema kinseyi]|uniref:sterol O-acyltransferase 1 n=1 Tax=Belonocnema kinseyi TaxID=2817044 RepID=UPI00143DE27C|nr:sterol O-acyltransferase 1 [Belonocnema kinseyi]